MPRLFQTCEGLSTEQTAELERLENEYLADLNSESGEYRFYALKILRIYVEHNTDLCSFELLALITNLCEEHRNYAHEKSRKKQKARSYSKKMKNGKQRAIDRDSQLKAKKLY